MELHLKSTAFGQEQSIPERYTCHDINISPPLEWDSVPTGAQSLALICEDPDAPMGTFTHWVLYDLPPSVHKLPEQIPTDKNLPIGAHQGTNSTGRIGYTGPCPPSGTHRYYFKLFALDTMLNLKPGAGKNELLDAMQGHIIQESDLMGKHSKR